MNYLCKHFPQKYTFVFIIFLFYYSFLKADKTEFIIFGSKIQHKILDKIFHINILGNLFSPAKTVSNLSVWFDWDIFFSSHIQNICKSCFAEI